MIKKWLRTLFALPHLSHADQWFVPDIQFPVFPVTHEYYKHVTKNIYAPESAEIVLESDEPDIIYRTALCDPDHTESYFDIFYRLKGLDAHVLRARKERFIRGWLKQHFEYSGWYFSFLPTDAAVKELPKHVWKHFGILPPETPRYVIAAAPKEDHDQSTA